MSDDSEAGLSWRRTTAAATAGLPSADGTPEQIRLTWGDDPTSAVVVSWASAGQATRPRVRVGQRVIAAAERAHADARSGTVMWTYHALVDGLRPGATYGYAVTADNDSSGADPFSATFSTAPAGRARFRFTSFGDLATPDTARAGSRGHAAYAVAAVETFQPLFHLVNGDLRDAGAALAPAARTRAWRDFRDNVQASAASRPWMPAPGGHGLEPGDGAHGLAACLTRDALPSSGAGVPDGLWYAFRVGTALFVCLSGDDVATAAAVRGFSGGAQTRWLESTLAAARADASIDWIVVQLHQCACSSASGDPAPGGAAPGGAAPGGAASCGWGSGGWGSDLGVRREWLPLFDRYEVDLVLSGHDRGYERSFPVRGCDTGAGTDARSGATVDTRRPRPVTTVDSGVFDTSQGTVHLALGCGGSLQAPGSPPDREAPATRQAAVHTRPGGPVPGGHVPGGHALHAADAVEAATWSARRAGSGAYGIAVFDVNPGSEAGGQTSVTVRYYRAAGAGQAGQATGQHGAQAGDCTLFETFTLVRPRSDGRRWHQK